MITRQHPTQTMICCHSSTCMCLQAYPAHVLLGFGDAQRLLSTQCTLLSQSGSHPAAAQAGERLIVVSSSMALPLCEDTQMPVLERGNINAARPQAETCSHADGPRPVTWARWQASSNRGSSATVAALSPEEADSSSRSTSKKAGFGGVSCSALPSSSLHSQWILASALKLAVSSQPKNCMVRLRTTSQQAVSVFLPGRAPDPALHSP